MSKVFVPPHLRPYQPSGYELFSYDPLSGMATWRRFEYNSKDPSKSKTLFVRSQDAAPVLDDNKSTQYNAKGTFTQKDRMGVRAATIPMIVQQKWMIEDGVDVALMGQCPWTDRKIKQKLNSNEYAHLRVAEFRI